MLGGQQRADPSSAAADAARRRANQELKKRLEAEAAAAAAKSKADEDALAVRLAAQARAREANAAREAADAAAAASRMRAAWGDPEGSKLFDDALGVLCTHADNTATLHVTLAQLHEIVKRAAEKAAAGGASDVLRLRVASKAFPNANGALAALLALGFVCVDASGEQLLVLRAAAARPAALAAAAGRLAALRRS